MTEGHDDGDDIPRPTPGDWTELMNRVAEETWVKTFDPSNPLVKIGRFDAIAVIGEGGFGIVFKASDPDLDRLVALKLCRTRSERAINALKREAKTLAKLAHPNIVTIFEPGHHDGAVFFAMQHIAENAERFAKREPPPTWRAIVEVYLGAARGLAAAHAHPDRIVHGDVKPSNILVDSDGFSRIADFGLARRVIEDAEASERERLRRRAGTLYYMAPEALCGEPCDARSDQFSFFVALCQTLAHGKLPFYGKTSGEVLEAMEHTDILQFLGPWVPAELKAVIRIGLSLDPSERFPDMATVVAELERVLQMAPPLSSPPSDEPEFDEPEFDESESDESDGPERMHEPERADEIALMLGEPDVVGRPPSHEPEAIAVELPPGQLTSVGGDPEPRKAKRGTFAASLVLVGAVGLTIGWAGRGRVRVEDARVSEPTPAPESPCAMVASDPSAGSASVLLVTCSRIRAGAIGKASDLWDVEFEDRRHPESGDPAPTENQPNPAQAAPTTVELTQLRAETLIVARTFVDQAERMSRWAWVVQSIQGTATVLGTEIPDNPIVVATDRAEDWLIQIKQYLPTAGPGLDDPDLQDVRKRVDRLRTEGYSQHSTNPSSSRYP